MVQFPTINITKIDKIVCHICAVDNIQDITLVLPHHHHHHHHNHPSPGRLLGLKVLGIPLSHQQCYRYNYHLFILARPDPSSSSDSWSVLLLLINPQHDSFYRKTFGLPWPG
jgi:hypothetical protein